MDTIEQRLHDSSKKCFDCYTAWSKDQKNVKARGELQEAIHELRKVASRLEIELAVSERDEMAKKPIPIPPHRDARRKSNGDDNIGNVIEGDERGGHQGGHSNRKPMRRSGGGNRPQGSKGGEG